jgi:hypothetical protein
MTSRRSVTSRRTASDRAAGVRRLWWETIRGLPLADARAALLQALADIDEHWDKEHGEDGVPEDMGIPPDEYLVKLIERIRTSPPPESSSDLQQR